MDPTPSVPAPQLFSLAGQNVLITGATRGIGAACALALAEAGANICLVRRPGSTNDDTANVIAALGRTVKTVEADLADLDAVLNVNLKSVWLLSQAAGQHMVPRRRGKVINFCSLLTFQGGLTVPAYAAAKGALGQLTKALSNEWSKENVQVNGIAPGYIATDMNEKLLQDPVRLRQISERIPAGRWGEPRDFAGPVVFLASAASQYVCGEVLVVDGGWMGR
ncbi:NAD-P-binding protein [Cerioporus squamosus]|nr:NAD-P-binding protein [Cerioporus squamosus]